MTLLPRLLLLLSLGAPLCAMLNPRRDADAGAGAPAPRPGGSERKAHGLSSAGARLLEREQAIQARMNIRMDLLPRLPVSALAARAARPEWPDPTQRQPLFIMGPEVRMAPGRLVSIAAAELQPGGRPPLFRSPAATGSRPGPAAPAPALADREDQESQPLKPATRPRPAPSPEPDAPQAAVTPLDRPSQAVPGRASRPRQRRPEPAAGDQVQASAPGQEPFLDLGDLPGAAGSAAALPTFRVQLSRPAGQGSNVTVALFNSTDTPLTLSLSEPDAGLGAQTLLEPWLLEPDAPEGRKDLQEPCTLKTGDCVRLTLALLVDTVTCELRNASGDRYGRIQLSLARPGAISAGSNNTWTGS